MPNRLFKSFPAIVQTSGTQFVVLCGRPQPSGALFFLYHITIIYGIYLQTLVGLGLKTIKVNCAASSAIVCFMRL